MTEKEELNPYRRNDHPEMRKGEVWITNLPEFDLPLSLMDDQPPRTSWESIGWRTKRRGQIAYDVHGRPILGMFPVFAQRSELEKVGADI